VYPSPSPTVKTTVFDFISRVDINHSSNVRVKRKFKVLSRKGVFKAVSRSLGGRKKGD
jgi:hypothetical protein